MKSKAIQKRQKDNFSFTAPLAPIEGNYVEHGIFLPTELIEKLPQKLVRAKGTINNIPFALAIQYRKNGLRFIMTSKALVKSARLKLGLLASVTFTLVDSDIIEMPEELEAVLEQDEPAKKIWETFTLGRKRGLAYYVNAAKSTDSRIKRALEIVEKAKQGTLYMQKKD
jgi:hypothetical protein